MDIVGRQMIASWRLWHFMLINLFGEVIGTVLYMWTARMFALPVRCS